MNASFLDFRRRTGDILQALNRNESITLLYRGKAKAVISPLTQKTATCDASKVAGFGMWADRDDLDDVETHVRSLRKGRYDAL